MIKEEQLKPDQVVFVYSQPPEEALIGVIQEVEYPLFYVKTVFREAKHKFEKRETIDLTKNPSITILSKEQINTLLTKVEMKRLKEIEESEIIDMFNIHN